MTDNIRVVLADDQRVVREGLSTLLGLLAGVDVLATAADGDEAVALARQLQPDVVLMDLRMPRCDGVDATRRLRQDAPAVKVLVLTTYADDRSVIDALRAGARGYLTKDAGAEEIHRALLQVVRGQAVIDPSVQHHVVDALAGAASVAAVDAGPADGSLPDGLTPREAEVLALIAGGRSNTEIASELFVSETTIKSHINHLFAKTGVQDRAQAVAYAYRHGLAGG
jgi:DNA-binding NarL/FixJ family response regulator